MIEIHLRDYLLPNGVRPYSQLPIDMEAALATGQRVLLISVPGFIMASGSTEYETLPPWSANGEYYATAKDCIDRRNPVQFDD